MKRSIFISIVVIIIIIAGTCSTEKDEVVVDPFFGAPIKEQNNFRKKETALMGFWSVFGESSDRYHNIFLGLTNSGYTLSQSLDCPPEAFCADDVNEEGDWRVSGDSLYLIIINSNNCHACPYSINGDSLTLFGYKSTKILHRD